MPAKQPVHPIRLHRFSLSGHAHRVELFLSLLGLSAELIEVDLRTGAHRQPDFLAKNPYGQVPVLEDGDITLADSNAILVYLAAKYGDEHWLPRDPEGAAAVQQFLSLAAGEIANGPATARRFNLFGSAVDYDAAKSLATRLFSIWEQQLATRNFLTGAHPTIADIACYSYTAHAPEGGISLQDYPHIRARLKRIEALPGFVPMQASKVTLAA